MDAEFAERFTEEWQAAWNSHDIERILTHYADDVVFQSPYVAHRFQDPAGQVRGKEALRSYWGSGLHQQPAAPSARRALPPAAASHSSGWRWISPASVGRNSHASK